ncbi:hypothetical protein QYZ41_26165 [Vibrio parahaemolyticus]|nr:hypothetical protein [Vibrio parahaemolyticus]
MMKRQRGLGLLDVLFALALLGSDLRGRRQRAHDAIKKRTPRKITAFASSKSSKRSRNTNTSNAPLSQRWP